MNSQLTSLQFTEDMKGFVVQTAAIGDEQITADAIPYNRAFRNARRQDTDLMFHATIRIPETQALPADNAAPAPITGWIRSPFFGEQCRIHDASFQLFVPLAPNHHEMRYRIVFSDVSEKLHTLIGFKTIRPSSVFSIWRDTTTLFTRIYAGALSEWPADNAGVQYVGILRIGLLDFMKQMTTLRTKPRRQLSGVFTFFGVFARRLLHTYVLPERSTP